MWRGIPVNHYVSCQSVKPNSLLRFDYYFKSKINKFSKNIILEAFKEVYLSIKHSQLQILKRKIEFIALENTLNFQKIHVIIR